MRVVVAEDNALTRQGLVLLLEASGIEVIGSAADAQLLQSMIHVNVPDVAILDIRMPPTFTDEGLRAAARMRSDHPRIGILVLSHHIEPVYAARLLADYPERTGYLLKDRVADVAVLVDALNRIVRGETVIDPTIVARLLGRQRERSAIDHLSPREQDVLRLLAEGRSNGAIAAELLIGERTVESHVASLFQKLEIDDEPSSNRRVLAVLAYLRGPAQSPREPT